MSLSTTNESSSKADQIAHKFFTKFALLLHHARATPHLPGPRLDKWFNLETPDTDQFRDHLRMYRSISTNVTLPPFELQILLSVPELATNQVLVLSDTNTARSRVDPTPSHVLLESWVVVFSPDRDSHRYEDRPDVALSSVYKQSISVFRSMFTLLRVLPAWRLFKRLRRGTGSPESSQLGIQVRVADANNEARMLKFGTPVSSSAASLPTSTHAFPPVSHPFGTLTISTTYLLSPLFHIDTLESLLSSRFLSQDESFTPTIAARQQSSLSGSPIRTSTPRSPPGPSLADRFVLPANSNATTHSSPLRGPPPSSVSRNSSGGSGSTGSRPVSVLPPSAESPRSASGSGSPRFGTQALPETAGPQPIRRPSINAIHPFKSSTLGSPSLHSPTTSSHRQSPLSAGPSLPSRPPVVGPLSSSPSMRPRLSSSPGARPTYPPAPPSPMSVRPPSTRPSPPTDPSRPATGKRYSSTFGHRYASTSGPGSEGSPGKKSDERPGSASFLSTTTDDDDISAFVQAIDARAPLSNRWPTKREESESTETGADTQPEPKAEQDASSGNGSGSATVRKYKDRVDDELRRMNDAFMQSLVGLEGRSRRDNGRGRGRGGNGGGGHSRESTAAPGGASPSFALPPLPDSPAGRGSPLRPSLTLFGGSASPSGSGSPSTSGHAPSHHRAGSAASGSDEIIGRLEFDERPGSRGGYSRPYR